MDRKRLISLLERSSAWDHQRTRFCPDDSDVAGFVDGTLPEAGRVSIRRHLPDCPACVQRVGLLTRLLREQADTATLTSARRPQGIAYKWAAAASVILAVGWVTWFPVQDTDDFRETRAIESRLTPPEILAPAPATPASREGFVIRWTEVPGSLYYEVRIVTEVGDLLLQQRVDQTEWVIGKELEFQPGREYFIRVDAYLSDAKTIRSEHVPFRLRE
jgi:hypothetical protein